MSENSFKSISIYVIASVIAGVVLSGIPQLKAYFISFLNQLGAGVLWCWNALIDSYALPGWAWLFIFLLALNGLARFFHAIRRDELAPEYEKYVEDFIYNIKWRWTWVENSISDIWCFCPDCDATLVSRFGSLLGLQEIKFMCENCNRVVTSIPGSNPNYVIDMVKREIHRRIRTGDFKATSKPPL